VARGVYPNFVVHRREKSTKAAIAEASGIAQQVAAR
jgi:hypothetical protein